MESVADIAALQPTLVIGSVPYKQETVGRLLEQCFSFLAMNPRTLADVYADIRLLGGIAGRTAAAQALAHKMQREFAAIGRKAKKLKENPGQNWKAWRN